MSSHSDLLFDLIKGEPTPTGFFGLILSADQTESVTAELTQASETSSQRISEIFGPPLLGGQKTIDQLEQIATNMWEEGWSPEEGNINLFSNDFGVLLAYVIWSTYGGKLTFRDARNMLHASIYWEHAHIEAFPFHRAIKRFLHREGESLTYFFRSLGRSLSS